MTSQTAETLEYKIRELAGAQVDMPAEKVTLDSQFEADLGYDSLDYVEFLMTVEEEFDIEVSDEIKDTVLTVRNAVEAVEKIKK